MSALPPEATAIRRRCDRSADRCCDRLKIVAVPTRLEPVTFGLGIQPISLTTHIKYEFNIGTRFEFEAALWE
jgi:hypothetical protein